MNYLSVFSGIGGLEATEPPVLLCESDEDAAKVLNTLYPSTEVWPDIRTLHPPEVDVVAGGWPCQDLSIAGQQAGLVGLHSGLLLEMLRVTVQAKAHTVVAENVPNLLRLRKGQEFRASLEEVREAGFHFVAWRMLNAREFGLPQNRSRILLVASKHEEIALTLFRELPDLPKDAIDPSLKEKAAGFYWTAGTHSINYSRGYVPTIKVGSSVEIPSPPAVHYGDVVRRISPVEALALQGFQLEIDLFKSPMGAYKAAGNAVAKPIGKWVMDGLAQAGSVEPPEWLPVQGELWSDAIPRNGYPDTGICRDGEIQASVVRRKERATNLYSFLDHSNTERLSSRASSGLLKRLDRSGHACPPDLRHLLEELALPAMEAVD